MARVNGSLGALVQGVSQQPDRARRPGQSELQENVSNDEVFGLSRRPGARLVESTTPFGPDNQGEENMEYGTFLRAGRVCRYGIRTGAEPYMEFVIGSVRHEVHLTTEAASYLLDGPHTFYGKQFEIYEINGINYVLNKSKTVAMDPTGYPSQYDDSYVVYLRGGQYAAGFQISARENGGPVRRLVYSTPDGSVATHSRNIQPQFILRKLDHMFRSTNATDGSGSNAENPAVPGNVLQGWTPQPGLFYATAGGPSWFRSKFDLHQIGDTLLFEPKVPGMTLGVGDSTGLELIQKTRNSVANEGLLPPRAPVGKIVRVKGAANPDDDYYLRAHIPGAPDGAFWNSAPQWVESGAPGQPYQLDAATMPMRIVFSQANQRYEMRAVVWTPRDAGDDNSNPVPKFVGENIDDLAEFQERLVVVHGKSVSMSDSTDSRMFFKDTAAAALDTHPIHIQSTATKGDSHLVYGVNFRRDLVLYGTNSAQFMIRGNQPITASNAVMNLTSEFDMDTSIRPIVVGDNLLFTSYTGRFTQLHEMFLVGDQNNHERRTPSGHVPKFMVGRATMLTGSDGDDMVAVVTDGGKSIYAYEYLWQDRNRVQSAWSRWIMPADVKLCDIQEGIMYLECRETNGSIHSMELDLERKVDASLGFHVHLDGQSQTSLSNETTVDAFYTGPDNTGLMVFSDEGLPLPVASRVDIHTGSNPKQARLTLKRPYTGIVTTGVKFKSRFKPTMPLPKDGAGVVIANARIGVTNFDITVDQSGPFEMTRVSPYEAPEDYWKMRYSGRVLGDPDFRLGDPPIDSTTVQFPFEDDSRLAELLIETDGPYPLTISEIDWTGNVDQRTRRLMNAGGR